MVAELSSALKAITQSALFRAICGNASADAMATLPNTACVPASLAVALRSLFAEAQQMKKNEFAQEHPIIDAMIGGLILAAGFGGMIAIWISVGAGL